MRAVVQFPALFWAGTSVSVTDLIKGMLKSSPTQRLRIEQVLSHQWLKVGTLAPAGRYSLSATTIHFK